MIIENKQQAFILGFTKTLPFQGGVIPFGVLYATLAIAAGFQDWLVILFSVVVFAGSSQLVFIDLFQSLMSPLQAVLGSNIVNARHLIYSAGVSNRFSEYPRRWRLLLSYLLTDQLYAVSQAEEKFISTIHVQFHTWFYFGSGFCTWIFWIFSTALGIGFGKFVPASWNLGFSIPLMFMPLIFTVGKSKYGYISCLFSVFLVYLFQFMPFGLNVFFAILVGSFLGYLIKKYSRGRT